MRSLEINRRFISAIPGFFFFLRGLLFGFFLIGPGTFGFYFLIGELRCISFMPGLPSTEISMKESDIFFAARAKAAIRMGRTFYVGSSELISGTPSVPRLVQERHIVAHHGPIPVYAGATGPGVWRGGWLLSRLHSWGLRPRHLIIVVNPNYAQAGYVRKFRMNTLYFPDMASFRNHLRLAPGAEQLTRFLQPDKRKAAYDPPIFLYIRAYRRTLREKIGHPLFELSQTLFSPQKSENSRKPAIVRRRTPRTKARQLAARKHFRIPADLAQKDYGRSLEFLHMVAAENRSTQVVLLLQPLNRRYYRELGLDAAKFQKRLLATTRKILKGSNIRVVLLEELDFPGLFADPVHFNRYGRELLAEAILIKSI